MDKTKVLGDVATPLFATLGLTSSTSEIMEYIFLSLTIVSLLISIGSRLYTGYQQLKNKHTEASRDGVITKEEIAEMTSGLEELVVGVSDDATKIKEAIDERGNSKKD